MAAPVISPQTSSRLVVDPALVAEKDRAVRHLPAAIDESAAVRRVVRLPAPPAVALAALQAQLVARVDPVRVLDLRVVRPDARPLVRVLEVEVADAPERVAAPDDVRVRRVAATSAGATMKTGLFSPPCTALPPAASAAVEVERVFLVAGDGVRARLGGVAAADRAVRRLRIAERGSADRHVRRPGWVDGAAGWTGTAGAPLALIASLPAVGPACASAAPEAAMAVATARAETNVRERRIMDDSLGGCGGPRRLADIRAPAARTILWPRPGRPAAGVSCRA